MQFAQSDARHNKKLTRATMTENNYALADIICHKELTLIESLSLNKCRTGGSGSRRLQASKDWEACELIIFAPAE